MLRQLSRAPQRAPKSPQGAPGSPRELLGNSPGSYPDFLRELPEALWSSLELASGFYRFFRSLRVLQDDPGQAKSVENTYIYIYTCIYIIGYQTWVVYKAVL